MDSCVPTSTYSMSSGGKEYTCLSHCSVTVMLTWLCDHLFTVLFEKCFIMWAMKEKHPVGTLSLSRWADYYLWLILFWLTLSKQNLCTHLLKMDRRAPTCDKVKERIFPHTVYTCSRLSRIHHVVSQCTMREHCKDLHKKMASNTETSKITPQHGSNINRQCNV